MSLQDLKEIISIFSPLILALMGYIFSRKLNAQKKELIVRDKEKAKENEEREKKLQKLVVDKLEDVEIKLTNMEISFNLYIKDSDFRSEFRDTLRNKSRQILSNLSNFLTQEHKNILSSWSDSIEKFGLDFYYTSKRKERRKGLDNYLTQMLDIIISDFYNYIDFSYEEVRVYNKKPMLFSQFVEATNVHKKTEMLRMRLVANGFRDTKEVIELFSGYIEDFFSDFTNIITIWERLELLDKNSEAA